MATDIENIKTSIWTQAGSRTGLFLILDTRNHHPLVTSQECWQQHPIPLAPLCMSPHPPPIPASSPKSISTPVSLLTLCTGRSALKSTTASSCCEKPTSLGLLSNFIPLLLLYLVMFQLHWLSCTSFSNCTNCSWDLQHSLLCLQTNTSTHPTLILLITSTLCQTLFEIFYIENLL